MCVYAKNMALGQVVTNFVGHVDTVWNTKNIHQNNIKVKICNYSWSKSLELIKMQPKIYLDLRNSKTKVSEGSIIYYIINYFPLGPTVCS